MGYENVVTFGRDCHGRDVAVRIDPPDPKTARFKVTLLVDGNKRFEEYEVAAPAEALQAHPVGP